MSHPHEGTEPHRHRRADAHTDTPVSESLELATRRHLNRSPWNWLLVVPLVLSLLPWIYNRREPALWDIPFFYWFQMACVAVGVACTWIVYRATRGER